MGIADFNYHRPATLAETCRLLEEHPGAALLAGGTDLLVDLKLGKRWPRDIISLASIGELHRIEMKDDTLVIGASVTHNEIIDSPLIQRYCPAFAEAVQTIGTEQIRNTGTVGGNLCTAASCADTAPILIALGAEVELVGAGKTRSLPLRSFFTDHRKTALGAQETLAFIRLPLPGMGTGAAFQKFGLREAANISVASVAAMVRVADEICVDACCVMGAVAPTPRVSQRALPLVKGKPVSEISPAEVGRAVAEEAEPIDDLRASARFRRELTDVLTRRALGKALERARRSA